MKPTVGDRVGAIRDAKGDTANVYGFGVYEGEHPMTIASGSEALVIPNPRIKLDNGKTIWGFQCWWGPEDAIKARYKNIVTVDFNDGDVRTQAH